MNTAYTKAKNWGETFNISSIRDEELLHTLTIRQLKIIASMMNNQMGVVISKSKFGKAWSAMKKAELINAIWFVRRLVMCAPQGKWMTLELSRRISSQMCDGVQHVVYFGFNSETEANKFYYWLNADKSLCTLAAIRPADRMKSLGFKFEIKVWGIDIALLTKLVARDNATYKAQASAVVESPKVTSQNKEGYNTAEQIELSAAQRMYNTAKSNLRSRDAMVAFLKRSGFEISEHVVYQAAEF